MDGRHPQEEDAAEVPRRGQTEGASKLRDRLCPGEQSDSPPLFDHDEHGLSAYDEYTAAKKKNPKKSFNKNFHAGKSVADLRLYKKNVMKGLECHPAAREGTWQTWAQSGHGYGAYPKLPSDYRRDGSLRVSSAPFKFVSTKPFELFAWQDFSSMRWAKVNIGSIRRFTGHGYLSSSARRSANRAFRRACGGAVRSGLFLANNTKNLQAIIL